MDAFLYLRLYKPFYLSLVIKLAEKIFTDCRKPINSAG